MFSLSRQLEDEGQGVPCIIGQVVIIQMAETATDAELLILHFFSFRLIRFLNIKNYLMERCITTFQNVNNYKPDIVNLGCNL